MMTRWILLAVLLCASAHAADKQLKAKLATLAPKDSSPHQSLKVMAEAWRKAPGGGVALTIYTDGVLGGEADTVRRIRIGQLQAAMLTGVGLAEIDDSITALQTMPLVFRSLDEVDYVREKLQPKLDRRLADKGFVMLFWTDAGWVKFFSRRPAVTPEDFKKQKMFSWAGDTKALDILKALGYQPVALETADMLPGLQTGLIDVVPTPPFFALAAQFYGPAPNMLDMNWAPLVGGLAVSKKFWDTIPAAGQQAIRQAAVKAGDEIRIQARKEMVESVEAMKKRGMTVRTLTPEAEEEWRKLAEQVYPRIRGKLVPADLFDEVQQLLKDFRAGKK
ncbi:MAG: C4-dicarboxylate ABC transporter substrate-binding protein [Verrucomicrobia bacterium]|nr:C4-dicarboxylate ABC transporter substrate-binding protein [Verrucomicrobiota bacterium]